MLVVMAVLKYEAQTALFKRPVRTAFKGLNDDCTT